MDFDMLTGPLTAWELSCVEMRDNVCSDAHMEFDLGNIHLTWKGGGGYGFLLRNKILFANLIEKKILSMKWAKKIFCYNIVFVETKMYAALRSDKKNGLRKNP